MWLDLVARQRAKEMSSWRYADLWHQASERGSVNGWRLLDQLAAEVRLLAARVSLTPMSLLRMKKHAINRATELAGFRTTLGLTPETNAMLHYSTEVHETRASIRENGLRATIDGAKARARQIADMAEEPVDG